MPRLISSLSIVFAVLALTFSLCAQAEPLQAQEVMKMPEPKIFALPPQSLQTLPENLRCYLASRDLMNDHEHFTEAQSVSQSFKDHHCMLNDQENQAVQYARMTMCAFRNMGEIKDLYFDGGDLESKYKIDVVRCFQVYPNSIPIEIQRLVYIF